MNKNSSPNLSEFIHKMSELFCYLLILISLVYRSFTDLELPLLLKRRIIDSLDLSIFTQNLRTNPQTKDQIIPQPSQDIENCAQNMVGRKGFSLFTM
jgi:hypothetical protein